MKPHEQTALKVLVLGTQSGTLFIRTSFQRRCRGGASYKKWEGGIFLSPYPSTTFLFLSPFAAA